jgi:hypothetical protein
MKFNIAALVSSGLEKIAKKVDTLPTPGQMLHNASDKVAALNGEAHKARVEELKALREAVNKEAAKL